MKLNTKSTNRRGRRLTWQEFRQETINKHLSPIPLHELLDSLRGLERNLAHIYVEVDLLRIAEISRDALTSLRSLLQRLEPERETKQ